jgi:hypothetical protein
MNDSSLAKLPLQVQSLAGPRPVNAPTAFPDGRGGSRGGGRGLLGRRPGRGPVPRCQVQVAGGYTQAGSGPGTTKLSLAASPSQWYPYYDS